MKDWFKRGAKSSERDSGPSVDDLIVLEKYEEAETALRQQLKRAPKDLRRRLQLGSVLANQRKVEAALEEFFFVADAYSQDGFQDKAIALLMSAKRLAPANPNLEARIARSRHAKEMARMRSVAVNALKEASRTETGRVATAAVELEQIWDRLAKTDFVQDLPPDQVKHLFGRLTIQRVRADQKLVDRGQEGSALFLISGGEIEARIEGANGPIAVRSYGAGDIVGEAVLFEHEAWPAELTATLPGSILVLDREGLEKALQGNPDPRGLLSLLRSQRNDSALSEAIEKLGR